MMIYRLTREEFHTLLMLQYAPKGSMPIYSWMGRTSGLFKDGTSVQVSGIVVHMREYLMMPLCIDFNNEGSISIGIPATKVDVLTMETV